MILLSPLISCWEKREESKIEIKILISFNVSLESLPVNPFLSPILGSLGAKKSLGQILI